MNNKRLEAIYQLFDCNKVIDIGSDHGYLPLTLLKNQCVNEAIIVEVNQGPLDNAIRNTKRFGLMEKTTHILSDGLQAVDAKMVTGGVVIAGMGGKLIEQIIKNDLEKFKQVQLFLQPNNNEARLRKFLNESGFKIIKNILVEDEGIIYEVIIAELGVQTLTTEEIFFGYQTTSEGLFTKKWLEQKIHLEKLIKEIRNNGHQNNQMEQEYAKICEILGVKNEIK